MEKPNTCIPKRKLKQTRVGSWPVKNIPVKSIAVLPFLNIGNDPDQEYFSDGMAEEIINSLTNLKDLKVAGRTSSFKFRIKISTFMNWEKNSACLLYCQAVFVRQGNRLRITAQLVNIEDGYQLWSEKYDREMDDVFAIQDDIALAITKKLKLTLLKKDHDLLTKCPTKNTKAYELYLKGRFYVTRRGAWMIKAHGMFSTSDCFGSRICPGPRCLRRCESVNCVLWSDASKNILARAKQSAEKAMRWILLFVNLIVPLGITTSALNGTGQRQRKFSKIHKP